MLSLFDNKCYKTGNAKKLVIFVHGYNGSPESINYAVQALREKLTDAVVVVPRAPYVCEKNGDNLQWLSFYEQDPDVRFRNPDASIEEIFDIFNRLGDSFANVAEKMNDFIDEQQKIWNVSDDDTYIMGFSQGAMISIYTALIRKSRLAGCIVVAGIIPGMDRLEKEIVSKPNFLILHGKKDVTVQYKTFSKTIEWFRNHQITFKKAEFDNLDHRMNNEEMQMVADFVNS